MAITTEMIKQLREKTGAGVLDCRNALESSGGDIDEALDILREKGLAMAAKRASRMASEGVLDLYSHGGGRVGVMVEVNCETDFVGRSEAFRHFAHEIALQIAASDPHYISDEEVPAAELEYEEKIAAARAKEEGKAENIIPRIVEGALKKYKDEVVLLRQPYIRDESMNVQQLLNEAVVSMGENILIHRFVRWELGGASEGEKEFS